MKFRLVLSALATAGVIGAFAAPLSSALADEPKNLKVLDPTLGKKIGAGMKSLSKGLGTKCESCHVKGKLDLDDKGEKLKAREFLAAVIGEKDQAKRDGELKKLLGELKLDKAKDPAIVWEAVDMWKKQ
jgi:hypothetical protein